MDEIHEIAKRNFSELSGPPKADDLDFSNGNKYDALIRGWTKYWNDVLKPKTPLDPNLVKALIASESSFNANPKVPASAKKDPPRGLMQVRDSSFKIMGDICGELKNHLINLDGEDPLDPNTNIAAGVRWLFRKKEMADSYLGREATWDEVVQEYKGILRLSVNT